MRLLPFKQSAGFTLVEVIVALGIFTLVIAGGLAGVQRGFDILRESRNYTRVSQILQSEVESMRSLSWSELGGLAASAEITMDTQFDTDAYDIYTIRRNVVLVEPGLREITVSVSFETRQERTIVLQYVTFFAEGGVNDYYYRAI